MSRAQARAEGDTDRALFYNPEWKDSPEHKPHKSLLGDDASTVEKAEEVTERSDASSAKRDNGQSNVTRENLLDADEPLLNLANSDTADLSAILDDIFRVNQNAPQGEWENVLNG